MAEKGKGRKRERKKKSPRQNKSYINSTLTELIGGEDGGAHYFKLAKGMRPQPQNLSQHFFLLDKHI